MVPVNENGTNQNQDSGSDEWRDELKILREFPPEKNESPANNQCARNMAESGNSSDGEYFSKRPIFLSAYGQYRQPVIGYNGV